MPRRRRWPLAAGLAAGVALDALLGDPRRHHPVALFGQAAAALEARDYQDDKLRGALHTAACVLAVTAPAALITKKTKSQLKQAAAIALATWAVTGARSLHHEAERIMAHLADDDLQAARQAMPSLCGRDPTNLDATEMTRAVIESVAENTSDAIVAPLIWGAVAGLPGLAAYRATNTLDAMIGHRSERYLNFGWASARLDDVANYVPARVTAALTIACARAGAGPTRTARTTDTKMVPLPGTSAQSPPAEGHLEVGSAWSALRTVVRDGSCHPSPNAGQCEAAFAGALGLRLGGTNVYDGVTEVRPNLGDGRAPGPGDIARAVRLSQAVTWAATALAVLIAFTRGGRRSR